MAVDTEKFMDISKGIFAVGTVISGKLKLILSGFHEGALADRACFKLARPDEKYDLNSQHLLKQLRIDLASGKPAVELFSCDTSILEKK